MVRPWETDLEVYEDESELLAALQQREPYACTCFMKWYAPGMTRLAVRMVGDPDEAEGVVQQSFIAACSRVEDFRGESSLRTWLHRIVVNNALMRLRRRRKAQLSLERDEAGRKLVSAITDHAEEPLDRVLERELGDALNRAVTELPETLRSVFVLRELEDYSTREAAEALGISESAVKVRLHRARQAIRPLIERYQSSEA